MGSEVVAIEEGWCKAPEGFSPSLRHILSRYMALIDSPEVWTRPKPQGKSVRTLEKNKSIYSFLSVYQTGNHLEKNKILANRTCYRAYTPTFLRFG